MVSREVARAARRRADQASARLLQVPSVRATYVTVTSVTGGVFFDWRGGTYEARRLVSYTPAVDDRVLMLLIDGQPTLLGPTV